MYVLCMQSFEKITATEPKRLIENPNEIVFFNLFLYCGKIQRETVARKHCNPTLNLCTKSCVRKNRKSTRTQHSGFWSRPERNFCQMNKPTLLDLKVISIFWGYWTFYVSPSSHSASSSDLLSYEDCRILVKSVPYCLYMYFLKITHCSAYLCV